MVKHTVYRISVRSTKVMGVVTLCRKNGERICRLAAYRGQYYVHWANNRIQVLSPKCGLLIGCHAIEIDTTLCGMVVSIPRNSGFTLNGMT